MPQWNCSCANCAAARSGKIAPQTQSSVAVSADGKRWFLINASPDLTQQIEAARELQPSSSQQRSSPIAGVLLTNPDIDHVLGLLLLRQQQTPLPVYATQQTRDALGWIDTLLTRFGGIEWRATGSDFVSLDEGVEFRAIELSRSIAFCLRDQGSGRTAVVAPAVGELTDPLREAISASDLTFLDGTFWTDDELRTQRPDARTAREMNHLPIQDGSFDFLRESAARRKIYIHINNTNPILMPDSPENTLVQKAEIEIARDGMEFAL